MPGLVMKQAGRLLSEELLVREQAGNIEYLIRIYG
jgi:hypothetical protein